MYAFVKTLLELGPHRHISYIFLTFCGSQNSKNVYKIKGKKYYVKNFPSSIIYKLTVTEF